MENKQKRMADEMDINLDVFNLETGFFGDLHCSSRFTDMLCDAQAQYGDYSELDMCPMWGMWKKEVLDELGDLKRISSMKRMYIVRRGFNELLTHCKSISKA